MVVAPNNLQLLAASKQPSNQALISFNPKQATKLAGKQASKQPSN